MIRAIKLVPIFIGVIRADEPTCSNNLTSVSLSTMFGKLVDWANNNTHPDNLQDCAGYATSPLGLFNASIDFAINGSETCVQAFVDFYDGIKVMNLSTCYVSSVLSPNNPDCASMLAPPLANFGFTFGNGMDLKTGSDQIYRCDANNISGIENDFSPFAPMFAMALKNEQIGDPMVQLNRLIEIYYSDAPAYFLAAIDDLPCKNCFYQFLVSATSSNNACFVNDEQTDGCYSSQAVVIGLDVFYPNCPACKESIATAHSDFIYCLGGVLNDEYAAPIVRDMYAYNATATPKCNDTIADDSYYGFVKCALMFPNATGDDALDCIQNDLVVGPDFRITPCQYAWGNMILGLPSTPGLNASCPLDGIEEGDCDDFMQTNSPSPREDFRTNISNPDFTFGSSSPYTCWSQDDSDAAWVRINGRPGLLWAVFNSSTAEEVAQHFLLNPVLIGNCVQCVVDVAVSLFLDGTVERCIQNITDTICPQLEFALNNVYPTCSGQQFNIPTDRCENDETLDWSSFPPITLIGLSFEVAQNNSLLWQYYIQVLPLSPCIRCAVEFVDEIDLLAEVNASIFDPCFISDGSPYNEDCVAQLGGVYERFETCHGNYSMYACDAGQWDALYNTSVIVDVIADQLLTAATAEAAFTEVRSNLTAALNDLNVVGCVWCVQDLFDTLWPDIVQLRSDCSTDFDEESCENLIGTPLANFQFCSGHELTGLFLVELTTTTTTTTTTATTSDPTTTTRNSRTAVPSMVALVALVALANMF